MSGVTIDDRWFCSHRCVEGMVQRLVAESAPQADTPLLPPAPRLRLGVLLRYHGALSADQLHHALEQQRKSGLRLGAQARVLFGIDPALVLRALAAQAGTRYLTSIDPASVQDAPGGLSRETVKALGLIPFSHPDRDRVVRVASTAPMRWDALNALRQLARWTPEPYLVEDGTWSELLEQYGAAVRPTPSSAPVSGAVVVRSAQEAVAQIALIATAARKARLVEAHWNPYTWVRVEGESGVRDVLFARTAEERSWQAASTSH